MRGWDYNPAHRDARRRHRAPDRGPTPLTTSARVNRRRPCRKFSSTPIGLSIRYEGRHDHPSNRNSDAFEVDGLAVISQLGQDLKHDTAPERPLLVGGRVGPGARRSSCRRRDQRAAGGIGFRGRLLRTGQGARVEGVHHQRVRGDLHRGPRPCCTSPGERWSGCRDSNPGPPAPQAGALARLRYIPIGRGVVACPHLWRDALPRSRFAEPLRRVGWGAGTAAPLPPV